MSTYGIEILPNGASLKITEDDAGDINIYLKNNLQPFPFFPSWWEPHAGTLHQVSVADQNGNNLLVKRDSHRTMTSVNGHDGPEPRILDSKMAYHQVLMNYAHIHFKCKLDPAIVQQLHHGDYVTLKMNILLPMWEKVQQGDIIKLSELHRHPKFKWGSWKVTNEDGNEQIIIKSSFLSYQWKKPCLIIKMEDADGNMECPALVTKRILTLRPLSRQEEQKAGHIRYINGIPHEPSASEPLEGYVNLNEMQPAIKLTPLLCSQSVATWVSMETKIRIIKQ